MYFYRTGPVRPRNGITVAGSNHRRSLATAQRQERVILIPIDDSLVLLENTYGVRRDRLPNGLFSI